IEIQGPLDAGQTILPEAHRRIVIASASGGKEREAARKILERFASRAFRRPAEDDEVERLTQFAQSAMEHGDSFAAAVKLPLKAILVSPHFLFRIERDREPQRADKSYALNDY